MAEDFVFKIKAVPDLSGFESALKAELKKLKIGFGVPQSFSGMGNASTGKTGTASMIHAERNATRALLNFSSAITQATRGLAGFSAKAATGARAIQSTVTAEAAGGNTNFMNAMMSLPGVAQVFGYVKALPSMAVNWSKGNIALAETQQRAETQLGQIIQNGIRAGKSYDSGTLGRLKEAASAEQARSMYGDEAILGGVGELSTYVGNEETLKKMIPLLTDYAAGMTGGGAVDYRGMIDLATGLGKALDGTYENLRKKGFDTSELEELSARSKAGEEITDDMKVAALERALADYKGLAQAMAETPMGVMEQVKNSIGDAREEAGYLMQEALLPIFRDLRKQIPEITEGIKGMGEAVAFFAKIGGNIATTVLPAFSGIAKHSEILVGAITSGAGVMLVASGKMAKAFFSMTTAINASATAATKASGANGIAAVTNGLGGLNSAIGSAVKGGLYGILAAEIMSITNAVWQWYDQKKKEKEYKQLTREQDNTRKSVIETFKRYDADREWTDLELQKYKEVWEAAKKIGVDMSGSEWDIFDYFEKEEAKRKGKSEGEKQKPPKIPKPVVNISADFNSISRLVKENLTEILRSQLRVIDSYQAVNT